MKGTDPHWDNDEEEFYLPSPPDPPPIWSVCPVCSNKGAGGLRINDLLRKTCNYCRTTYYFKPDE